MYREMYSRFRDSVKIYTQKLDIEEMSFMALLTEGVHIFQRETLIWEKTVVLHEIDGHFYVPSDMIRPIWLRNECGATIVPQDVQQLETKKDQHEHFSNPNTYDVMLDGGHRDHGTYTNASRESHNAESQIYAIFGNEIIVRHYSGDLLYIRYNPYFEEMSFDSNYWNVYAPVMVVGTDIAINAITYKVLNGTVIQTIGGVATTYYQGQTFVSDGSVLTTSTTYAEFASQDTTNSWYFVPNFMNVFTTRGLPRVFKPFKSTFIDYCVGAYLLSIGMINQGDYYYKKFLAEVNNANARKMRLFNSGKLDYSIAPNIR